ncbi:MAG: hypothetical protein U9N32_02475, partial [Spirochaetota bacterium]|nr:hypothetical protein [Spirochaetota bacterium]
MNYITAFLISPSIIGIIFLLIAIIFFILILSYFILKRKIIKDINKQIERWNLIKENISINYSNWILLFFSNFIEKLSIKNGLNLPVILKVDNLWIEQVNKNGNIKAANRVLKYSPDKGLFTVMEAAFKKNKLQSILIEWIDKSGEFLVL